MNVYDDAHRLAAAIKNSNEFKDYENAQKLLDSNPSLSAMMKDFQEKAMEMQLKQMSGEEISADMNAQMQQLYGIVMQDPMAAQYMQAELRFSVMMKDVIDIIQEAATPAK
ncbi:MAG: YlbF family regulator [Clostridia bacterium]|nr:YlbF family regulator [Clostridia bacterium]